MERIIGFTKDGMPIRVYNMQLELDQGLGLGGIAVIAALIGVMGFIAIKASAHAEKMARASRRR